MKSKTAALAFAFFLLSSPFYAQTQAPVRWLRVWSEEFNGAVGTVPDSKNWQYDVYKLSFELETYTNAAENAQMDGQGNLRIRVLNPSPGLYTSARIKTLDKFSAQYGRLEARIKVAGGVGMWPAFWMMGSDYSKVGWPLCGEIDIMEYLGSKPNIIYASLHSPNYNLESTHSLPPGRVYEDDFHVYGIVWSREKITWTLDGVAFKTVTRSEAGKGWVFDKPFFFLLNVAVGGPNHEPPNNSTKFPADMLVDYVRAYVPLRPLPERVPVVKGQ